MIVIPVCHCFDNRYVLPAAVSFYSMLKNANQKHHYALYVLHTDITMQNQKELQNIVAGFANASLEFIQMNGRFKELFNSTKSKNHYSKEMFYKFCPPSLFPQYDKILISDVDVVWDGDISTLFFEDISNEYLAGSKGMVKKGCWVEHYLEDNYKDFSTQDRKKLLVGAGLLLYNLAKMRADNLEQKFIEAANTYAQQVKQPEQDILNLVCWPHIKIFPANALVCNYAYEYYPDADSASQDLYYKKEEILFALKSPIQLHYAGPQKPWQDIDCVKSERWFYYLMQTPFAQKFLTSLKEKISSRTKAILTVNLFHRKFILNKLKEKK